jgi:hypothetical protein
MGTVSRLVVAGLAALAVQGACALETGGIALHMHRTVLRISTDRGIEVGGVHLNGNVNLSATAQNITTSATGPDSRAVTSIGVIYGGTTVTGDTTVVAQARDVTTVASGPGNIACTQIGVIGDSPDCQ